jgi:hypothetical protein
MFAFIGLMPEETLHTVASVDAITPGQGQAPVDVACDSSCAAPSGRPRGQGGDGFSA